MATAVQFNPGGGATMPVVRKTVVPRVTPTTPRVPRLPPNWERAGSFLVAIDVALNLYADYAESELDRTTPVWADFLAFFLVGRNVAAGQTFRRRTVSCCMSVASAVAEWNAENAFNFREEIEASALLGDDTVRRYRRNRKSNANT